MKKKSSPPKKTDKKTTAAGTSSKGTGKVAGTSSRAKESAKADASRSKSAGTAANNKSSNLEKLAKVSAASDQAKAIAKADTSNLGKSAKTKTSDSGKPTKVKTSSGAKAKVVPKTVVAEIVDDNDEAPAPAQQDSEYSEIEENIDDSDDSLLPAVASTEKSLATTDPVALYLSEVRKYPLLTKEQEQELAKKYYETKDPVAAQALVTANLRFVVKVAAEYSRFGARMIDLIQEGNMGLMHAVKDFNPYKGVRLITYAVWWIRGYIQEYLMKQYSLVKIGTTQNQKKLFYKLQKEKEALEKMGEDSSVKLIAEKMGIPEDEVRMMTQRMSGRDVSLNAPMDSESPSSLMDLQKGTEQGPDEALSHREELSQLHAVIEELRPTLSEREKIILDERILNDEPLTLQEIGEKYNITREAVRQMEVRVMKKIKDKMSALNGE